MRSEDTITCVEDLRRLAMRRVPKAIFEYADRGSYAETTIAANRADLTDIALRQRVMIDVDHRSTSTTILGREVAFPVAIAPTGLTGLFHRDGEIRGARAAARAGVPFCLSTMSICSIEDVRAGSDHPFWFQLYFMRDKGINRMLIERAIAAECPALVLTLDLQVQGQRHRDLKNGLTVPPRLTAANVADVLRKPRWALGVMAGKRRTFGNLAGVTPGSGNLTTLSQWIASQFDPSMTWRDVEEVRALWPGKLILKGIMDVDDARAAVAAGADAIVVSNHGGRQLDGAPSSISQLPVIASAIGDGAEILFDGGIQSGQDVLRALACGARACLLGKAFLYGLAAMGEQGVVKMLEILRNELDVSMALSGLRSISEVDSSIIAGSARTSAFVTEPTAAAA
jgi:L-lactate dehydrogenase (cytochrome)